MRISDTDINRILDAANIVDVIKSYVTLRKSGSNFFGCCPFHDEATASMCVSPAKRIYKCFGCGEHGNVIWFVHKIEGISYPEAAMILAKQYHIDIKVEEKTPEEVARDREREEVMIVLGAAQKWLEEHVGNEADRYITSRGLNDWARREFHVGASGSYRQMYDELSARYKPEIMQRAGIVYTRDNGERMDYFRNRITFPFLDRYGRVIGFTARDITGTAKAKYLNSPDTIVFKKGSNFFGLYQARTEITKYSKDLDRIAEMIAEATEVTRTRSMKDWSKTLYLPSEKALKDIVKPYITRKRSKNKVEAERENLDDVADVDGNTLPDYVEDNEEYKRMLSRYGFYPLLSKSKNEPVCYMFKNDSGGYGRVCDFFMTPLLHVYDKDPELNKRIVKITSMAPEIRKAKYVEWKSSVFANMATFRAALVNEGAYNFENGNIKHYDKIWTWMSHQFKTCFQLRTFGQQKEDFFAWSNAIFHRNEKGDFEIKKVDNLGLVEHGGDLFYSPAYSEIYAYDRSDSDIFEQDRHLRYIDVPESRRITFAEWADLMNRVYRIEDNGKWAIIYSILCGFRSDLYPVIGNFTAIFFIGQTSSGKSQIAQSIRALYEVPSAPSSNLNQISDAAFFSILERFRDVPCIFEEYNDEEISDQKFQGLKAVTYDGDGKQKRRSATGNDIETSKVNASIILLGQEAPQRDDNALSNRVVLCEVPAHNFSGDQEAQRIFKELKGYEKEGLSYLLVEVQKLRPLFRSHFIAYMEQSRKELQDALAGMSGRSGDQSRIIGTVSMFLATCRLLINDAAHLKLPFSYDEFFELAVKKVRHQCEMLAKSDKLATFFGTLDFLVDKGTLKIGRDFTIDEPDKVTLKGGVVKPIAEGQKVMYMNLTNVHKHYLTAMKGDEKPLTLTTLLVNLKSHPAYIGDVSNKKFIWEEEVRTMRTPAHTINKSTMMEMDPDDTMVIKMQKKSKQTSAVVLDYNILQQFMGIDFEHATEIEEDTRPF